jgi:hypothetical protein
MVVQLPDDLSKKISALKKARGNDWDKELAKAIDELLAESTKEQQQAVKALGKLSDKISARANLSAKEIAARLKK